MFDTTVAVTQLNQAVAEGKLSAGAVENIRIWLTHPRYAQYAPAVAEHLAAGKWKILDDVFWTVIPFGTGGRRGMMYPIGTNAINDRTIGESAQGLADYAREHVRLTTAPFDAPPTTAMLRKIIEEIDCEDMLMFATDYPHWHYDGTNALPDGLSGPLIQKILVENALKTYPRLRS